MTEKKAEAARNNKSLAATFASILQDGEWPFITYSTLVFWITYQVIRVWYVNSIVPMLEFMNHIAQNYICSLTAMACCIYISSQIGGMNCVGKMNKWFLMKLYDYNLFTSTVDTSKVIMPRNLSFTMHPSRISAHKPFKRKTPRIPPSHPRRLPHLLVRDLEIRMW